RTQERIGRSKRTGLGGTIMKRKLLAVLATSAVIMWLAVSAATQKTVTVQIKNCQGEDVGTAKISPSGKGLRIKLDFKNVPPGEHATHTDRIAKCEGPAFTTP